MNLTPAQLHTLRHMLGINTPGDKSPKPYRNYYAAEPGNQELIELERLGAVYPFELRQDGSGLKYYACTRAGIADAIESHKTIRHNKARRVYLRFLDARDAFNDLTFKRFLTDPYFQEARRLA